MPANPKNYRWIFAISAAVVFPALILHTTCIAVMGPGTWGSGMEEALPEFSRPTAAVEKYQEEFAGIEAGTLIGAKPAIMPKDAGILGEIRWSSRSGNRRVLLTEEIRGSSRRQHLYASEDGRYSEIPIPPTHLVVRPKWAGDRIIYERWNPWAVPPVQKLRRYVASWIDASLRPEASLYGSDAAFERWQYLMPGHSLALAPNGRRAALLRSGALLAGYYSIHVWQVDTPETRVVISLREHSNEATRSFALQWSTDSAALRIFGRTGGFERRSSRQGGKDGIPLDLVYLVTDETIYDLNFAG